MRDSVGDQEWQAGAHAEKSFVFRDHHGVLEFDGRDLLARRVDAVGNSKLRQGPAAASRRHRTWRKPGPVPECARRLGVPGKLAHHRVTETQRKTKKSLRENDPRTSLIE